MDENAWFDDLDAELDFLAQPEMLMAEHLAQIGIGLLNSATNPPRQLANIVVGSDFVAGLELMQGYWIVLPTCRISRLVNLVPASAKIPQAMLIQTNLAGYLAQLPKLAEVRIQVQGQSWCRGALMVCEGSLVMIRDYQAQATAFIPSASIDEVQILAVDNSGAFLANRRD
ncbi:hypothetical protein [Candidatus Rhodoluna planktonica]|uniref:Uncharacterized protein n=1 Tax=Candidatus Rhodoluna planktonica TaxID=535712 RepID=A0A1D9DZY2_9MICO|nr:hypothetical protein [Candidatus Rhodoluna planktonica]AOY56364.1 hypothetical protein A4Z71_05275 [Candidatus Rhodoluna planktonica]